MKPTVSHLAFVVAVNLLLGGGIAYAQAYDVGPNIPKPRSDVGGAAGEQLRQIYRTGIGQGYSAESQNQLAMQRARSTVPYVGQSTTPFGVNRRRIDLGITPTNQQKPFANVQSRPAVSPYLNLFREDLNGYSDLNYQTLVRPQLEQQQMNQRFQDETQQLSRRVQQISAQPAYNPRGSQTQYPTGHQTVFGHYGRFYPSMNSSRR